MPTLDVNHGDGKKVAAFSLTMLIALLKYLWNLFSAKLEEGDPQAVAIVKAAEGTEVGKLVQAARGQKVEAIDFAALLKMLPKLAKIASIIASVIPQIIAAWTSDE